jgi:hypothetical protein
VSGRDMEPRHRYRIFETGDGFLIDGGTGRAPVRVTHGGTCWLVEGGPDQRRFGLCQITGVADAAAGLALAAWHPRPGSSAPEQMIRTWACQQTARAMAHLVAGQANRLLPRTDQAVLYVQRAVFAATFGVGSLILDEAFYRAADPYVISDISKYRAAAIVARNLCEPWGPCTFGRHGSSCGLWVGQDCTCTIPVPRAVEYLKNWRDLLSPTGKPYTSLNRTLMNLPGGVSHHLVCNLARIQLERPVTDRVEFTVVALSADYPRTVNQPVFQRADREQIERALRRVAAALHTPLTSRRTRDLRTLIGYVADYPEHHDGTLSGLADRAIRWHRQIRDREVEDLLAEYGGDHPVTQPPIPLPDVPGIRFLGRVSDLCLEGREMRHCIASYAGKALAGDCFLFHVEHRGEVASVEVDRRGRVLQAYGPEDRRNAAARWGEQMLRKWGRTFPITATVAPEGEDQETDGIPF